MLSMNYKHDDGKFFDAFQNIDVKKTGLWVRWLWPDHVKEAEIDRELKVLADAGIAGAEIGLHAMGATWGTDEYFQGLIWAMRSAKKYGLKLDFFLTVGTLCLPQSALPVDCDAAEKILFYYDTQVTANGDGKSTAVTLGLPKKSSTTINARLVAVSYARIEKTEDKRIHLDETCTGLLYADQLHLERLKVQSPKTLWELLETRSELELIPYGYRPDTHKFDLKVLEQHADPLNVTVDLPAAGKYAIFAYWEVPSDKTFGGVTQYCCDHYSVLGTKAVTDYYDRYVEKYPELGQLFQEVGRAFFGDSLENNGNWTLKILDKYQELFGSDFTKYLYAVANAPWHVHPEMGPPPQENTDGVRKGAPVEAGPRPPHYGEAFQFPDPSVGQVQYTSPNIQAMRNSYYEAMTQCFIEGQVLAFQAWADKYGMDLRCQSTYGQKQFMAQVSTYLDMAETESLAFDDQIDGYRGQAGSVHMRRNGSGILSSEQGENRENQFHSTTWSGDFLWRSNRFYAAGGNQLVYHVFSYTKYDEPIPHGNGNMVWPGFRPQPNVGDNLQFNRPTMGYMQDYSKYIARTQLLLQTGEAKLDAAIYFHNYNNNRWDFQTFYHDDGLEKAGYSYEFIDPSFFELENAMVEDGVFAPDGPGYRAFLFLHQGDLPVAAAEKLLGYANRGLPMIFAGGLPQKAAYFGELEEQTAQDEKVRRIMAELRKLPNVAEVSDCADWPEALGNLGVRPSLDPVGTDILYAHRQTADADYYFLYNQKKYFTEEAMWLPLPDIHTDISLKTVPGRKPYLLNLWSGAVTPVTEYTENENGEIFLPVFIKGNDTLAIVLAEDSWYQGEPAKQPGELVDVIPLSSWTLRLLSHEPGEKALSGENLTDTEIVPIELGFIGKAKPWTQFKNLPDGRSGEDISGVGVYETTIYWEKGTRLELDLGEICDLYCLRIRDAEVPGANPIHPVHDITAYLQEGENRIQVEVASNFFHAERSRNYLNCNWVERKPYTAWNYGILGKPVLRLYR